MKDHARERNTNTAGTDTQGGNLFNRNRGKKGMIWNKTGKENLVRHKSGRYYARVSAGGKEVWKSLKTLHLSVAQARLAEFLKEHRQRVGNGGGDSLVSVKMAFGAAAEEHLRNLDNN